ncbi:hypothetical protein GLYMA_02G300800v4 [Glycine max]|uniref:Uncharacterized protein n=2 Tax=Glycine subgen. Soja TaxID=1462606 RepID=K7KBM8_SOYBN|nr:hypothetical protein JHK87_005659 [Glycine soja]KAG5064786.1 hypothetical protein JHK85_005969 [Glycine max]KAG5081751.1 hypothetical protein JHK86_005816 [Glycine max]KAH1062830.1 hypothetical protein GYH30_005667 [Glycine max]KRH73914.1 hypothetical protein GLYMA_02G300800v4 [Glycine max]
MSSIVRSRGRSEEKVSVGFTFSTTSGAATLLRICSTLLMEGLSALSGLATQLNLISSSSNSPFNLLSAASITFPSE